MKADVKIFTTAKTRWFADDLEKLRIHASKARGITLDRIDVEHIKLDAIPTHIDGDGDRKPNWDWFKERFTRNAPGYRAVMLHISREEKRKYRLTVNGSYNRDPDEVFECWFSADKGQRSEHYWGYFSKLYNAVIYWSEWLRLAVHELFGGHGFERFFVGYRTHWTHEHDYGPNGRGPHRLPELVAKFDARRWGYLFDILTGLRSLFAKQQTPMLIYPIESRAVSQRFGAPNKHYKSGIHFGVDHPLEVGTPIRAMCDGFEVYQVFKDHKELGNACYVRFVWKGKTYHARFMHLHFVPVKGVYNVGDTFAYSGDTGDSTGPHLHWDLWKVIINPTLLLTKASVLLNLLDPVAWFEAESS